MKKILSIIIVITILLSICSVTAFAQKSGELTILYTHDIHDYFYPTKTIYEKELIEHGGGEKLATIIKDNKDENSLYLDAGDFSMGTLYQAAYSTNAYELINLGLCGCDVTTFGNHEFDYGLPSISKMLRTAKASGEPLPKIVQSNIDFSGELTDEQKDFQKACEEYGVTDNVIIEKAGHKIGIFGLLGYDCIECIQTDLNYIDYLEAATNQVNKLKAEGCDIIIALSHAGTTGDGKTGEDFDLADAVPDIDIIISGHSHTFYDSPVINRNVIITSCGEYLTNVGKLTVSKNSEKTAVNHFELIKVNKSIKDDKDMKWSLDQNKEHINNTYLKGKESFDEPIAHSNFDFIGLDEMYETHGEYPTGDLIADSYIYEAKKNGIDDIDVAIVGLGTIRGSIKKGDITVADAFEICSLGVGADGSAGHPLLGAYITGEELKLVTELDASLGEMMNSIKMSYSGLNYIFDTKRIILDRVTEVYLVDENGNKEEIDNKKLYKVCVNMYAANMLGMLNGLTRGILSITPKDKDGNEVSDFYSLSLLDKDGKEIKEWIAFKDYLESFDKGNSNLPEIPSKYKETQNRKNKISEGGIKQITKIGTATNIMSKVIIIAIVFIALIIFFIILTIKGIKKRKRKRKNKNKA